MTADQTIGTSAEEHDDDDAGRDERPAGQLLGGARPDGGARRQAAAGPAMRERIGRSRQELAPLARIWLTCWAALASAACGWLLPSSTDTIMLPRTVEICG